MCWLLYWIFCVDTLVFMAILCSSVWPLCFALSFALVVYVVHCIGLNCRLIFLWQLVLKELCKYTFCVGQQIYVKENVHIYSKYWEISPVYIYGLFYKMSSGRKKQVSENQVWSYFRCFLHTSEWLTCFIDTQWLQYKQLSVKPFLTC